MDLPLTEEQDRAMRFARMVIGLYDHGLLDGDPDLIDSLLDIAETWCDRAGVPEGSLR